MGKSYSKEVDANFRLDLKEWEEVSQNQMQPNNRIGIDQPVTLRNRITGELVDAYYPTFLSQKQYDDYRKNLDFRRNQPNIVRALYYKPNIRKQFCSTNYAMTVFIEHVRGRLSQYKDIPLKDSLYCMIAMLDGYKKLFNEVGRFYISQDQVIIDEQGEVRVWLNSDLSKDTPEESDSRWSKWDGSEYDMVDDIISIIIDNTDEADGPRLKFSDFYERQKVKYGSKVGFEQARHIIFEYAQASDTMIQKIFQSVLEIYQQNGDIQMLNQNQYGAAGNSDMRNLQDYPFDSSVREQNNPNASHQSQSRYARQDYAHANHYPPPNPLGTGLYSKEQSRPNLQQMNSQRQFHNQQSIPQKTNSPPLSYLNSRSGSTQNFFTQPVYPRAEPNRTYPKYPSATNPQIIINRPPVYHQSPPKIVPAPIFSQKPPLQIRPNPNFIAFNSNTHTGNIQNINYQNAPVKIQINGQNLSRPQQQIQNKGQVIAAPGQKVIKHNIPEIKEQVNQVEIIRQLDEFHRQDPNQYSSEREYEGQPNQILDEAIEEDIQRQIGIKDQDDEEFDEVKNYYDEARNAYGEQYYNEKNQQSNNSRQYMNLSGQRAAQSSSHRNSIQNNSIHNNSVHNNSIHNNSMHNNSIHNSSHYANQNSGAISNNSAFKQSSGQIQENAYWQKSYSIPPVPNQSVGSAQKIEVESVRKYGRKEKEIYYTLSTEMELDPEIAADLAMLG